MRWPLVAFGIVLSGVIGCADQPLAPSPVEEPASNYVAVHRGRCPADRDLPFSVREAGWFWPDTCRNNHGEIIQLSDWCSGTRRVVRGACVLNTPTKSSTLTVTGPATVPDNACEAFTVSGGTGPYQLTTAGGRWLTSAPCRRDTPTRYTLLAPGSAVWSATGLDAGDSAQLMVTDDDGATQTLTLSVV